MNKSESDKLLDAIGGVNDRWVKELMEEPTAAEASPKVRTIAKRLAVPLIAAAMCIALAVTCFANADLIKSLFQREQELIDPYAVKVDESVTVGDITLTIDKIAWGGEHYIYYTFKNNKGIFDKGLTFDRIAIKEGDDFANRDTVGVIGGPEERGSDPGSSIAIAGYGLENPSDTISAMFRTDLLNGIYTLAFENVTSYDGSVKYADEIEFEVDISVLYSSDAEPAPDEEHILPEPAGIINPVWRDVGDTFEIEGTQMGIERIGFSPYELYISIREYGVDTVNYYGHDFYYLSYLTEFSSNTAKESVDALMKKHLDTYYSETEASENNSLDDLKRSYEIAEDLHPHEAELEALTYKVYVEFADGCSSEIISREQNHAVGSLADDDGKLLETHIDVCMSISFSSPVYEEEILEIYLLRESDGARVTIYEKPE